MYHRSNIICNRNSNKSIISLLYKFSCFLLAAFFLIGFSSYKAEAAQTITIYDYTSKQTTTYTGVQPTVLFNGAVIGNPDTPGILVNGIAVLPYDDIFKNSKIAAECGYNKDKATVTIAKYGITIIMKVGSKNATVNGKTVTMPVAPLKIKYVDKGVTKILVPSRFVAETLKLGYTWNSSRGTISIEKYTLSLSYDSQAGFEYTGVQGKVSIDGKNLDLGTMPSIITNNTAMLRAKKVFADSVIDADYFYDKTSKRITLIKGDNILIMTLGSKEAMLNNKAVRLDMAPMNVTNCDTGTSYIMVPGGFTAAALGYDYNWNNSTKTSMISTRKASGDTQTGNGGSSPELGDSGLTFDPGTVINQWYADQSKYLQSTGVHELTGAGSVTANINYVSRDYSVAGLNKETYIVAASAPFGKVRAAGSGNLITVTADNMTCTDATYQMYGVSGNLVNTLGTYNNSNAGTTIELEMLPASYSYDISFSSDNTMLYISVYTNSITAAVVGTGTSGDYLTLTGTSPITANISLQPGYLYIDLPYCSLSTGDIISNVTGAGFLRQIFATGTADKTQIILALADGYSYFTVENGNQYTILLQKSGTSGAGSNSGQNGDNQSENPQTGNQTGAGEQDTSDDDTASSDPGSGETSGTVVNADIPEVKDKSRYEIVIPIPSGITTSQITNDDYYNSHYFVIRIPGDHTAFYKDNSITSSSPAIDKISVALNSNNQTVIKIATTKLQGYELAADSSNLYINIGDPREIYKNIVLLDPGHGGIANGAQYYGFKEKDVNFTILYTMGKKYFNSDTAKLKVYYTRTSDTNPSLSERAAMVKTYGADLFVSLHMNAAESTVVGTEVFYSARNNLTNSAGLSASRLASLFSESIPSRLGTDSRGVKKEDYTVIYKNTVPAILIELGFLSTKSENARLTDPTFQDKAAKAIYETLLEVFEDYPTGR